MESLYFDARKAAAASVASRDHLPWLVSLKAAVLAACQRGDFSVSVPLPSPVAVAYELAARRATHEIRRSLEHDVAPTLAQALNSCARAMYRISFVWEQADTPGQALLTAVCLEWARVEQEAAGEGFWPAHEANRLSEVHAAQASALKEVLEEVKRRTREGYRSADVAAPVDVPVAELTTRLETLGYLVRTTSGKPVRLLLTW